MKKLILITLLTPLIAWSEQKVEFSCEPIDGEASFRVKGYFLENAQGKNIGIAHSYAVFGKYESIDGCRVPWYEKFPLSGSTSVKYMLHWREYMPGCMQRLQIPQVSAPGYMWVAKKDDSHVKSKPIKTQCHVSKIAW